MNTLYFGDCLDVLRDLHKQHPDGFIDLIYIDPPFNSKRDYNVLFEAADMTDTTAQRQAFADTWSNVAYLDELNEIQNINLNLYRFLTNLELIRIPNSVISYLTTMSLRIHYMHKSLKETGSFFLHCDPTMSHYLKVVCDLIFGNTSFRNEIVWHYTGWNAKLAESFNSRHDIILFYGKKAKQTFNSYATPWESESEYVKTRKQKIQEDRQGRKYVLSDAGNGKRVKRYLDEAMAYGKPIDDVWDIDKINNSSKEALGYPTQKPELLLERIIRATTNEKDIVADFFCGCGTTIAVAQNLKRQWIGVDISHLAVKLVLNRLLDPYKNNRAKLEKVRNGINITGIPKDIAQAHELALKPKTGRFDFQTWIVEVMLGGISNPKKTGDSGWDGYITFHTDKKKELVIIEVKSGHVTIKNIREFIQVLGKQHASIGLFVCFRDEITKEMTRESKSCGFYDQSHFGNRYPKLQIITVEELLDGAEAKLPESSRTTFKSAANNKRNGNSNGVDEHQLGLL